MLRRFRATLIVIHGRLDMRISPLRLSVGMALCSATAGAALAAPVDAADVAQDLVRSRILGLGLRWNAMPATTQAISR
jgi:hypothetical protein